MANQKIDYDKKLDGPPQQALKATKRSFLQSINPGYIFAGIASIWAAAEKNDGLFHKNIRDSKIYSDMEKKAQDNAAEIIHNPVLTPAEKKAGYLKVWKDFGEAKNTRILEDMGIKKGWRGAYERFDLTAPYQKRQFGLVVATVASVAIGAIYSFTRERRLADELRYQIANRGDESQSR